jgi:tRNA threonylcarbamoyladenosine biosynthesis protein TsaB
MFTVEKITRVLLTESVKLRVGAKTGQCPIHRDILRACRSVGSVPCSVVPAMPSLRQLLAAHPVLLVIDTSATRADAALWLPCGSPRTPETGVGSAANNLPPSRHTFVGGEAAQALPKAVSVVLADTGLRIAQLGAVAFCTGPGSVLGIRLAAASVRMWRAVHPGLAIYGYRSLPLLATAPEAAGATVIADARRDSWHTITAASASIGRAPSASLAEAGPLVTPSSFRRWSALPPNNPPREIAYEPARLLASAPDADLFTVEPEPDAFAHEQPSYVTWTPQIHQAPTSRSVT